ncbi:hypothetical protein BDR04DRAFT_1197236 [Suillus decipiens]|nr:hypothetical protein BDR04DRAFT_1197236 [Suillus decipiens]
MAIRGPFLLIGWDPEHKSAEYTISNKSIILADRTEHSFVLRNIQTYFITDIRTNPQRLDNYVILIIGSEPSTDTSTSIFPSLYSSMSTGGGVPTNGPPSDGRITPPKLPAPLTTKQSSTPPKQEASSQASSFTTSPTSGDPKNASPPSSSFIHRTTISPTTVSGAQSYAPQSTSGSSVNTLIPTGNGLSASSLTSSGGPVGNPFPTILHPSLTGVANNVISTPPPVPPSFSSITSTSTSTFTITTCSSFGSTSVLVTLTSISTSVIRTTTPIPSSGARTNEALIIGGVVGGVLTFLLLGIAAYCLTYRRRRSRARQQLYDSDLTAPLSPAEATTMRENHFCSLTYSSVMGEQSTTRGDLHNATSSVDSSAFPRPSITGSFPHSLSGSVFHENFDRESNDDDISPDNKLDGTVKYFSRAQNFYASNDGQSSLSGGIGIAIGSRSSMDLHSCYTATTTLVAGAHAIVDDDEESYSPAPSPSAFPIPPVNPFLDGARVVDLPDFVASRASQSCQAVSALSEDVALISVKTRQFSEQQVSRAVAVATASSVGHDAPTPIATRSLNIEDKKDSDSSSQDSKTPTQSRAPVMTFNDPSFIVNPLLRETTQGGLNEGSDGHETVSITFLYPFQSRDKGQGTEYLSADLGDNSKNNRLSNASSVLVFPENLAQCGLAL